MAKMAGAENPRRARRSFSDEFKAGAVRLVLDEGKSIPAVAKDLDLTESALRGWVERARADRGKGKAGALTTVEREELARLRKENRELKLKFEIVKKAAAYSTGQRNTMTSGNGLKKVVQHGSGAQARPGRRRES